MAWPFHTPCANLDEEDPPPPYANEEHTPQRLLSTAPNELKVSPLSPSHTRNILTGSGARRRGRPTKDLDPRTRRGVIRIFLHTPTPFDHIATAVKKLGGPGRQWFFNFFNDLTGTGPDADMTLANLRLDNSRARSGITETCLHTEDVSLRNECEVCNLNAQEHVQHHFESAQTHDYDPFVDIQSSNEDNYGRFEIDNAASSPTAAPKLSQTQVPTPRPSPTGLVGELDHGRVGLSYHVGRCCSVTKPTVASRMSSIYSLCNIRTSDSEFIKHYANLRWNGREPKGVETNPHVRDPSSVGLENQSLDRPCVLNLILQAPLEDLKEEWIESRLIEAFSSKDEEGVTSLVNESDERGVTALHLAVAFGLWKTTGLLIKRGAKTDARTKEGTCVNHFAKAAERFAGGWNEVLYFRIMYCRRHVKKGIAPPVPKPASKYHKRRMSEELQQDSGFASIKRRGRHGRGRRQASATTPSPGPMPNWLSAAGSDTEIGDIQMEPRFTRDITASPTPSIHANPSMSNIRDSGPSRNARLMTRFPSRRRQPISSQPHIPSSPDAQASFGTMNATCFSGPSHAAHYTRSGQDSFHFPTDWDFPDLPASIESESLRDQHAVDPFDLPSQFIGYGHAVSADPPSTLQSSRYLQDDSNQRAYNGAFFGNDQQHRAPQQSIQQETAVPSELFQATSLPAFSSISNERPGACNSRILDEPPILYWHCPHGKPRNYE